MQKIPTVFKRDYEGNKLVYDEVTPGCEWVVAGEGFATRKWDGTCCMVRDHKLYKRHEAKPGKAIPDGFEQIGEPDPVTEKIVGWVPVGDGPEDKWHREAFGDYQRTLYPNHTYELCGPKINGNPEGLKEHILLFHGLFLIQVGRTFGCLGSMFRSADIEGIVFYHPDGRMAKIKGKDFGIKRESLK